MCQACATAVVCQCWVLLIGHRESKRKCDLDRIVLGCHATEATATELLLIASQYCSGTTTSSNLTVLLRKHQITQEIEMQLCSGHQCTHTGAKYVLNNFICVL